MQTLNTQGTRSSLKVIWAGVLALILALSMGPLQSAYAVTSAEKYAEADAILQRVDALQTELNQAQSDYDTAMAEHEAAKTAMEEAQARKEAAEKRIAVLQERLGDRANSMYKGGSSTFLDVLLGASTFEEFLTSWDMIEKISTQDAELVQETKDLRAEAEAARAEFETQKNIAAEKVKTAEELKTQISTTQSSLRNEAASITAEAAALAAEEAAAAEAAAQAAEAQARASAAESGSTYYPPGQSVVSGSGILNHPLPGGTVSSTFGPRWGTNHNGVDFAAGEGTPYYAAESGTVLYATNGGGYNGGAGNWIVIMHGNGLKTTYMHSSVTYVSPGEQVSRGQNIGAVGNTGDSYGAHLHFEVAVNGTPVDPMTYL